MCYFDQVLREHPFVAGDNFSMADITVFAGLAFADAAGIQIADELAQLKAWRARVAELPAVKNRSGQDFEAEDLRRMGF
jgi:glutathione S-transferase